MPHMGASSVDSGLAAPWLGGKFIESPNFWAHVRVRPEIRGRQLFNTPEPVQDGLATCLVSTCLITPILCGLTVSKSAGQRNPAGAGCLPGLSYCGTTCGTT
jgi:hypothetical protein